MALMRQSPVQLCKSHTHKTSPAAAAKSLQLCPTLSDPIDSSPPGSPSLGFSRQEHGVGCHFLLQCMKVKSESEVAQSCLTLHDPMDCSPSGSSAHGTFQARVLKWVAIAFSAFLPTLLINSSGFGLDNILKLYLVNVKKMED